MKIALVHDYLAQDGGAEQVLKAFHELWPEAPIFVLFHDEKKIPYFNNADIRKSWLSKMPFVSKHFQWYLPWMPYATEHYNLKDFDVVISCTSAFAKGVIIYPHTLHISYCHTPTRYLWSDTHDYLAELHYSRAVKALLSPVIHHLRLWDKMSADRVDHFIANSKTVEHRIYKYYRRLSSIIFPPVDTKNFFISSSLENYFVAGGRLVPYKRLDLVIQVFNRLSYPLKIFGVGPELKKLQRMAKPNIEFLGRITDQEKALLLSRAQAFIHPQLEDAGVTPLESMASGRPVIAFAAGGAAETLTPNETGILFPKQTWESLLDAVINFETQSWNSHHIREEAKKFDTEHFKNQIHHYVEDRYEEFKKGLFQPSLLKTP
jgi:glycosyltransferase involved in cell wall biosynthesis